MTSRNLRWNLTLTPSCRLLSCPPAGPVCSACVDNFGARPVTIFSGVMVAGGLMLSAFAPNVQFLIFSYGIVVGEYASAASGHRLILFSWFVFPPVTQRGNTSRQVLHIQTLFSFH